MISKVLADSSGFVLLGPRSLQQTSSPPDGVKTLPELFAQTAQQHPHRPALSCSSGDGSFHTMSYSDVSAKVNHMADGLRVVLGPVFDGVPCQDAPPVVGIWFERSLDLTLAILTATTAGSTWLPFDPDAPVDRVMACLADSAASIILCDDTHYDRACHLVRSSRTFKIARLSDLTASPHLSQWKSSSAFQRRICATDPAYLIYTSGSK